MHQLNPVGKKMTNSDKSSRKKQVTIRLRDDKGNRIYIATDMGWRDPYWGRLKSVAIISTILSMEADVWIAVRISFEHEVAFTKQVERLSKSKNAAHEYFVIRVQSEQVENDVDSWFFIRNSDIMPSRTRLEDYQALGPMVFTAVPLEEKLKELFDVRLCPSGKRIRRWNASRYFRQQLRLYRMKYLINFARGRETHPLAEHVSSMKEFHKRLAAFIKRDKPLITGMKLKNVFETLAVLEKDGIISRLETVAVIREILQKMEPWELAGFYEGLPKAGAEADKKSGDYIVKIDKHAAVAFLTKELTGWEFPPEQPEVNPNEQYIE